MEEALSSVSAEIQREESGSNGGGGAGTNNSSPSEGAPSESHSNAMSGVSSAVLVELRQMSSAITTGMQMMEQRMQMLEQRMQQKIEGLQFEIDLFKKVVNEKRAADTNSSLERLSKQDVKKVCEEVSATLNLTPPAQPTPTNTRLDELRCRKREIERSLEKLKGKAEKVMSVSGTGVTANTAKKGSSEEGSVANVQKPSTSFAMPPPMVPRQSSASETLPVDALRDVELDPLLRDVPYSSIFDDTVNGLGRDASVDPYMSHLGPPIEITDSWDTDDKPDDYSSDEWNTTEDDDENDKLKPPANQNQKRPPTSGSAIHKRPTTPTKKKRGRKPGTRNDYNGKKDNKGVQLPPVFRRPVPVADGRRSANNDKSLNTGGNSNRHNVNVVLERCNVARGDNVNAVRGGINNQPNRGANVAFNLAYQEYLQQIDRARLWRGSDNAMPNAEELRQILANEEPTEAHHVFGRMNVYLRKYFSFFVFFFNCITYILLIHQLMRSLNQLVLVQH